MGYFIRMNISQASWNIMREKNLTEKEVMKLGIDLCKSLEYCGQLHIIHRDIKPENILYPDSGISSWETLESPENWKKP